MERRKELRPSLAGIRILTVDVRAPGLEAFTASVIDTTGSGIAVLAEGEGAPRLEVGSTVELALSIGAEEHTLSAELRNVSRADGFWRYGFEFSDPTELDASISTNFVRRLFNRRVAYRTHFAPNESPRTMLLDEEHGVRTSGVMLDLSGAGACLEVGLYEAVLLRESQHFLVEFQLPGRPSVLRLPAVLRQWRATGETALIAVEFDAEESRLFSFTRDAVLDFVAERLASARRAG